MLLEGIILTCLRAMRNERSLQAIFHLLTGKQAIQTIQDAHLFGIRRYYALYKGLTNDSFNKHVQMLIDRGYVVIDEDGQYRIAQASNTWLAELALSTYDWDGMTYHRFDTIFYERLLLFIQVWTNKQAQNSRYIPIIERPDIFTWIKRYYRMNHYRIHLQLKQLYDELLDIFMLLPELYPQLFIRHITTATTIGQTNEQLASQFNRTISDIYLLQMHYIHFMLRNILSDHTRYPLLYEFVADIKWDDRNQMVTKSAQETFLLVEKGYTPEQIARHRQLKLTTIYDHIVEIALHHRQFPIDRFVSEAIQAEIREAAQSLNTFTLKAIKRAVRDEISYFQIRLTLTTLQREVGDQHVD